MRQLKFAKHFKYFIIAKVPPITRAFHSHDIHDTFAWHRKQFQRKPGNCFDRNFHEFIYEFSFTISISGETLCREELKGMLEECMVNIHVGVTPCQLNRNTSPFRFNTMHDHRFLRAIRPISALDFPLGTNPAPPSSCS